MVADRSGEAQFLALLDSCEKLRNVRIVVNKMARDRDVDALVPDVEMLIEYGAPNVFRITLGDYWAGSNGTFVSDGKTLKIDGDFTELKNAPKSIIGVDGFQKGSGYHNLFFEFTRGRKALDLLPPDSDIVRTTSGIKVKTKEFGDVDITLIKRDGLTLPLFIDVSNLAGRMAGYRMFPMFSSRPEQPLERYVFDFRFVSSFPKGTFDTKPAKGRPFADNRKKVGV